MPLEISKMYKYDLDLIIEFSNQKWKLKTVTEH